MTLPRPRRILVLGASGGCGSWLVRLAAARGHQVTALVRPGTDFPWLPRVQLRRGEVLESGVLEAALEGQQVVASCLGIRRADPRNPWSQLLSPPDLTAQVAARLVPLMRAHRIPRVLAISAGGVAESMGQLSWPVRMLVRSGGVRVAYRDLAAMEGILAGSDLDWLAVRPVTLSDGAPTGRACRVDRYRVWSRVRRSDVAAWMLNALEETEPFALRRVMIGAALFAQGAPHPHMASQATPYGGAKRPALARVAP